MHRSITDRTHAKHLAWRARIAGNPRPATRSEHDWKRLIPGSRMLLGISASMERHAQMIRPLFSRTSEPDATRNEALRFLCRLSKFREDFALKKPNLDLVEHNGSDQNGSEAAG